MDDGQLTLGDIVTFSNGRSRPPEGSAHRTYGANGVIGTSAEHNAGPCSTIVGRVGSYCGAVHYSADPCWVTDNAIIAAPKEGVNPRYVYYLLKRLGLNRYRIGSGQPLLTHGILRRLPVRRLTRAEQDTAVAVLAALDDKIAVNRRIAECGDELVRVRYRRTPCRGSTTLGELGDLVRAAVPPARIGGDENYIALEHVRRRHMWLSSWTDSSAITSTKGRFASGDILFGKLRPYFHKVGLAFVDGVTSTDILVIRPKRDAYRGWLLAALSSDEVVAYASAISDGTRMPRTKWPDLARHTIPWPGESHAEKFNDLVTLLTRRVASATAETTTLTALRDTLLPTLIPGG